MVIKDSFSLCMALLIFLASFYFSFVENFCGEIVARLFCLSIKISRLLFLQEQAKKSFEKYLALSSENLGKRIYQKERGGWNCYLWILYEFSPINNRCRLILYTYIFRLFLRRFLLQLPHSDDTNLFNKVYWRNVYQILRKISDQGFLINYIAHASRYLLIFLDVSLL